MIRRDVCLVLALILMGGMIFWITQPRNTPPKKGSAEADSSISGLAKKGLTAAVAPIKSENSLLLGMVGEKGEASDRLWETSVSMLLPSLVSVQAYTSDKNTVTPGSSGTGVFVTADGYLLCSDVLVRDAVALRVRLADGTMEAARVRSLDHSLGLALLQVNLTDTKAVLWTRPSIHDRADRFLVVGRSASGCEWFSSALLTSITISEPARESMPPADRLLVFDAPISNGNGAVVVDRRGLVAGLVRTEDVPGSQPRFFVVPSHLVETSLLQMIRLGRPSLAQFGASVQALDRDTARSIGLEKAEGALVSDVMPGLAAESAGIEAGDVILGAGGFHVGPPQDLRAIMAQAPLGQALPVVVWRKGESRTVVVTPATPQAPYSSDAGAVDPFPTDSILKSMSVRPSANGGVEIASFRADQVVAGASLMPGDVLLDVDGEAVSSPEDFTRLQAGTKERKLIRLRVASGGVRRYLTLKRL